MLKGDTAGALSGGAAGDVILNFELIIKELHIADTNVAECVVNSNAWNDGTVGFEMRLVSLDS